MTPEAVREMCEKLASRFKNGQEWEDLISEGFIAAMTALEEDPDLEEPVVYNTARRAMQNYYNFKLKPVYIPRSGKADQLMAKIIRGNTPDDLEGTDRLLFMALTGETDAVEANTLKVMGNSTEEDYIRGETTTKVLETMFDICTIKEAFVLYEHLVNDRTLMNISQELEVSDRTVSKWKASGLKKLKEALVDT